MGLLENIQCPEDLKKISEEDLPTLASEMREALCESLNQSGGHFGAGLGTIELTIALHYIFNTPDDDIIWDVGHQAYPHKMLTNRKDLLHTIRKKDGLAPFPRREESPFDSFGVGHSSTSISAALGMAIAKKLQKNPSKSIAVIGDGAMTAGMAFEAMNHAGTAKADMLVILNDNNMSISENVGALSNYFARILSSKLYTSVKAGSSKVLGRIPPMWELARRTESHIKGMVAPGSLFEELGFNYLGPIDGHDVPTLLKMLSNIKDMPGPQLLHVITKKGKGYQPAEADPIKYHAVNKGFYAPKPEQDKPIQATKPSMPSYSKVFGDWLMDMAAVDPKLVAITPAMREGSGLVEFSKAFPDRYFDVAIAEQHAVTVAAGMACEHMRPVVAIYSTFLQRGYDQLVHDVAIQNLPVLFALDRSGIVGDGPTHGGFFDLSYLRCVPNMLIMAPSDANECRKMFSTGFKFDGPSAVRYPRGAGPDVELESGLEPLPIGKAVIRRQGLGIAILNFGALLSTALEVGERLNATVVDMRFVKPLDEDMIKSLANTHQAFVTLEENVIAGGAGSGVSEYLSEQNIQIPIKHFGLPDYFIEHGDRAEMLLSLKLDAHSIYNQITEHFKAYTCQSEQTLVESQFS
jgi:1-deoxy-D-xylulose-5-phosphate synthase